MPVNFIWRGNASLLIHCISFLSFSFRFSMFACKSFDRSLLLVIINNVLYTTLALLICIGKACQTKKETGKEKERERVWVRKETVMIRLGLNIVLAVQLFLVFLLDICKGKPFLQRIINFKKNVLSFKNKHVSKRGDSQFYKMSQLSNIWGSDFSFFC